VTLELEEEARPFHGWAYPNPHAHDGSMLQCTCVGEKIALWSPFL
jgi:hypothetical protein